LDYSNADNYSVIPILDADVFLVLLKYKNREDFRSAFALQRVK